MTIVTRLEQWKEAGVISPQQCRVLADLSEGRPVSIFLELNVLLYAGVLAFVGGLAWTLSTWSQQLGDIAVLTILSAMFAACFWYCFTRGAAWSPAETPPPSLAFDYVLYLGSLIWSLDLGYFEMHFHLLAGQWDVYLLASAALFFFLAYRFDNRFVLALALSSLAGWFGLTISHWPGHQDEAYRRYAILYSAMLGGGGVVMQRLGLKPHFFGTYLNIAANVLFWAVLSGVFEREGYLGWLLVLVAACAASLGWGIHRRQFSFVAYAAVYGYIGLSAVLVRDLRDSTAILAYFVFTAVAMLIALVQIARRFGRQS